MTTKHIRGIDETLYRWARSQAALEGKTLGQWINDLIQSKKQFVRG